MEKPKIAQKSPFVLDMEAGTYFWCACGQSAKQPFCDSSHKTTEFKPLKVSIESQGKKAWCACKQTSNPPYCDGTHKNL